MILLIDNYDSFTYNVYQYLSQLGEKVKVLRNDQFLVSDIGRLKPEAIVISPGPGRPEEAGVTLEVIRSWGATIPILGVCLGLQAIGEAFGGRVVAAKKLVHGKRSVITHCGKDIFEGIPQRISVVRYHSLVVDGESLPSLFRVTARTEDGLIMGLTHKTQPIYGVQFHPESYATEYGLLMFRNFLTIVGERRR